MYKYFLIFLLSFLSTSDAFSQYCGKDSGLTCPAPDQDGDGYTTDGTLNGYDCDDLNWQIIPGAWRFTAGQYSFCQANGTWSTGTAVPSASSGSGQTFFIDCDAAVNGSGTHASPWNTLRMVASMSGANTPVGWRNLVAGDAVFIAGTCDEEIDHDTNPLNSNYIFVVSGETATAIDPIKFISWAGRTRGHFRSLVYKEKIVEVLNNSQYIQFEGLELSGLGDYGLSFAGGNNLTARTMYIHDVDGAVVNNNSGAAFSTTSNSTLSHSLLLNNYDRSVLTGGATQNVRNVVLFEGTGNKVNYNVSKFTNLEILSAEYGAGIGYKHGSSANTTNSTFEVSYNVIIGSAWAVESGEAGTHMHHNYAEYREHCFGLDDVGGPYYPNNTLVEYNTCKGPSLININGDSADSIASNNVFQRNVHLANSASYNIDRATIVDTTYGSNSLYNIHVTPGAFNYDHNCYWNQGIAPLTFVLFAASGSSGASYNFTNWKLPDTSPNQNKPAWDVNSFNENPLIDSISRATSTNCSNKGYLAGLTGGASPTPTPSVTIGPSATPASVGDFNKRERWYNIFW